MCGSFRCTPWSSSRPTCTRCEPSRSLPTATPTSTLQSALITYEPDLPNITIRRLTHGFAIQQIMYGRKELLPLRVLDVYPNNAGALWDPKYTNGHTLAFMPRIPNSWIPSDHIPLYAEFRFL